MVVVVVVDVLLVAMVVVRRKVYQIPVLGLSQNLLGKFQAECLALSLPGWLEREREREREWNVHGTADVAIEELSLPITGEGVSSCIIRERDLDCWVGYKIHGTNRCPCGELSLHIISERGKEVREEVDDELECSPSADKNVVASNLYNEGTTNWDQTILPMLPSSMTAVGLRTLKRLGAPPVSMSLMMTINGVPILTTSLPCVTSNLN
ncbi:hypothetical protein CK203_047465 [Vitis vinifera]|uniref:Uncharacterized protein n=1 Tax=Vitis vinifera TaxID=29760 RepID=A0A438H638_VITVI|nr:hypothetical protein CK203_047465 [Vitis vinifera]